MSHTHTYNNNAPHGHFGENAPHGHQAPAYGHYMMPAYGYCGYDCGGYGHGFALIVVLFILLIIIGACTFCGYKD